MVQASGSRRVLVVLLGLLLGGCGGPNNPSRGGGHGGGSGGAAGGTTAGGGTTGGGGTTEAGGTTGAGGMAGAPCTPTSCNRESEFCATCGNSVGKCFLRPQDCTQLGWAVCGCDGKLYMNECEANAFGGVSVAGSALCPAPPGTFQCGTKFCTRGSQYCQTWYLNDIRTNLGRYVARYACVDLPAGECATTPTCACVTSAECGNCDVSADGDLTAGCLVSP
jgi:hypothetical protein